ncbi:hypothetical protein SLEP1_g33182 [Rubroshorea leprosula]|uniref:Uncharacterized protein n=1 Tax=Rubroshorea leprosula TaxID=152421 RepID=A0AAV5KG09_9ROSI|nr:hypothetical protein SLEP1_g33182 [Rubroshorea leprosula]
MPMSSAVGLSASASQDNHEDGNTELPLDLLRLDPAVANLSLPNETLLRAAISLKEQVVEATWKGVGGGGGGGEVGNGVGKGVDPTAYTGLLGTAFTCLRSYEVTGNQQDLLLCAEVVETCASVARASSRHVTFLCGGAGAYALGAVVAKCMGDHHRRDFFLNLFFEVFVNTGP